MRWVILAGFALMSCGVVPPLPATAFYRDRSVQIESLTGFEINILDGLWFIRGSFERRSEGTRLQISSGEGRLSLILLPPVEALTEGLPPGATWTFSGDIASMHEVGLGRWRADGRPRQGQDMGPFAVQVQGVLGGGEIWLLWADPEFRSIVFGNPRGTLGMILDRDRTGGEDRIAAARDAMAAMGYRVEEMVIP